MIKIHLISLIFKMISEWGKLRSQIIQFKLFILNKWREKKKISQIMLSRKKLGDYTEINIEKSNWLTT